MKKLLLCACMLFVFHAIVTDSVCAEIVEHIVAIVNDEVILLSEFQEAFESARELDSSVSEEEVLNGMVNSMLLLIEAKRFRISDSDYRPRNTMHNRTIIREYIDRRIKAFIHISHEDIESYYEGNRELFEGKEFYDVRDEIEEYLVNKELDSRLHEYIEELRNKAYVRIQLR